MIKAEDKATILKCAKKYNLSKVVLMKQKLLKEFKKKWERLRCLEENEMRSLSIEQKFLQLSSLIGLAAGLRMDFKEDKEKLKTRTRWVFLKKGL